MTDPTAPERFSDRGRVLVVDDQVANRDLLHDMLELDGHDVLLADNGLTALAMAADHDPDVVLLDVSMPGIDGFEVCRRLRATPHGSITPVLLITGLSEREHRIQGMAAGANDYLVKPIDRGEVSLRVRNALRMRQMHSALRAQYVSLQRLERMRDDLVAMVAHDLRSPLTGLRGFLELLQEQLRPQLAPPTGELLSEALRSVDHLNGMIGDMLDVSRLESDALPLRTRTADLREIAQRAIAALGPPPSFHPVAIDLSGDSVPVTCDVSLIQRVIINLLSNAVRFSPSNSSVEVTVFAGQHGGEVHVRDRGPGVADDDRERIFDKFAQGRNARVARARSTGLGLTFSRMVIECHGGQIGVRPADGGGSDFWFWIP